MERLIDIVPSGINWAQDEDDKTQIAYSLEHLEQSLVASSLRWSDVSLLWLANSRELVSSSPQSNPLAVAQQQFDKTLIEVLTEFCDARGAWPSLIGSTVKAAFCSTDTCDQADIGDGLMWVAIVHHLLPNVGLGVEITGPDSPHRGEAGQLALDAAVSRLTAIVGDELGVELLAPEVCEGAVGVVFTSGSGHVAAAAGGVDFKDCYGVGQGLLQAAGETSLTLVGGCASNRKPEQSQCLYYSTAAAGRRQDYHATYDYGAVVAVVPGAQVVMQLDHPYTIASSKRLTLGFHPHEKYSDSKYFCVRSINGRPPREFLEQHWTEISSAEFQQMIDRGLPIPAKPQAHYFSIASSADANPRTMWPNIPVYFEIVDGEVLLRLVRAESNDSYFYPIRMTPKGLRRNARDLANSMKMNSELGDSLVAFLCESRKYVLEDLGSNDEVEYLFDARQPGGCIVGVYLNGEYSTGQERSIGYHNYSQIGMIFNRSTQLDMPPNWSGRSS